MFCSVNGCFNSSDNGKPMKLLPKEQTKLNVWLKYVKLKSLIVDDDNKICKYHFNKHKVLVDKESNNETNTNKRVTRNSGKLFKELMSDDDSISSTSNDVKDNMDIINICRLCGISKNRHMKSVFDPQITSIPGFQDFVASYLEIQILEIDFLPKTVCVNCIKRIRSIISYKLKCQEVNKVHPLKIEPSINDYNIDIKHEFEFVASNCYDSYDQATLKTEVVPQIKLEDVVMVKDHVESNSEDNGENSDAEDLFDEVENKKIEIEDDNTNYKHECKYCHKFLRTRRAMRVHGQVCRLGGKWTGDELFRETCPICYKKVSFLKLHLPFHSKKKKFNCKICKSKFYVQTSLKEHMEIHNEKTIKCPDCDELLSGPIHLRRHKKLHNEASKKHMCEFCSKKFIKPVYLRMHIGVAHKGEKAFKCEQCSEGFNYRNLLHRHLEKVHNDNIKIGRTNRISKLYSNYLDIE